MAWGKFDDGLDDHPKMIAAGSDANWLWFVSVLYANHQLTDGFIPEKKMRRFSSVSHALKAARTLVRVGLWEKVPGGYKVHDFHDFNPLAADVKAKREADRVRKEKARLSARTEAGHADGQRADKGRTSARNPVASRARDPNPNPNPNPKKKEQAAAAVRSNQKKPRAMGKPAAVDAAEGNGNGNGTGHGPTPPTVPKLPYEGQRFVVFPWMMDGFAKILGGHMAQFDLPGWFAVLDAELVAANQVITRDERWPMLQRALKAEAHRRGLPVLEYQPPFTKDELRDAKQLRNAVGRCPHDGLCQSTQECLGEIIRRWRTESS